MEQAEGSEGVIESAEEFVRLRQSSDPRDYRRAAVEEASEEVWLDIIAHFPDERAAVAQNKTIPVPVMEALLTVGEPRVRFMVAMKRKLSPSLLDMLAHDEDESVRLQVARHRNATKEILESLLADSWSEVRSVASERLSAM
ncbi:hypothetical protein ACWEOA_10715 [Streptomyces sp. NPDC004457]